MVSLPVDASSPEVAFDAVVGWAPAADGRVGVMCRVGSVIGFVDLTPCWSHLTGLGARGGGTMSGPALPGWLPGVSPSCGDLPRWC